MPKRGQTNRLRRLLRKREAAEKIGVSVRTFERMVDDEDVDPAFKFHERIKAWDEDKLDDKIDARDFGTPAA